MTARRGLRIWLGATLCILSSFSIAAGSPAAQVAHDASLAAQGAAVNDDSPTGRAVPLQQTPPGAVDIELPSLSTGSGSGTLAVRVQTPTAGSARYADGAPVILWLPGGFELKGLEHALPPEADDIVIVTFGFPGDPVPNAATSSDGEYDGIYQLAAVWEMADRAHEDEAPSDGDGDGTADWCPGSIAPVALVAGVALGHLSTGRRAHRGALRHKRPFGGSRHE